MTDRPLLQLPAEAHIAVGADTLVIRHEGDVVLEQTLGRRLVRLEAGGDARLSGFRITGTLRAGGTLHLLHAAELDDARATVIEVGDVELTARALVATERIVVGRASLNVDILSAPEIVLHPEARGRVRVLDCLHDPPASRVRGCLSVAEYESDFGQVADFLARRGVTAVGAPPPPLPVEESEATQENVAITTRAELRRPAAPVEASVVEAAVPVQITEPAPPPAEATPVAPPPAPEPAVVTPVTAAPEPEPEPEPPSYVEAAASGLVDLAEALPLVEAEPTPPPVQSRPAPVRTQEPVAALPEVQEVDDPVDEPTVPPPPPRAPSRLARQVERALERLIEAYPEGAPEPVAEVITLARRGRGDLLSMRIDTLWVSTLRHHLASASPLPRPALLAFHALRDARTRA